MLLHKVVLLQIVLGMGMGMNVTAQARRCARSPTCLWRAGEPTGVWEKNTPFWRALTIQCSSKNSYPPPDLVLWQLIFPNMFFSGGVFFVTDTGITHPPTPSPLGVQGPPQSTHVWRRGDGQWKGTSLYFAIQFLVSLVKVIQSSPQVLYLLIVDPFAVQ